MRASSLLSRSDHLVCLVCQVGELQPFGGEGARCGSCGSILGAAMLLTLEQIIALPDASGKHTCECGHPEMRRLPDMGCSTAPPAARKCFPSRLSLVLRNDQCVPGGLARTQRLTAPGEPFGLSHCKSAMFGSSPQGMKAAKFALISADLSAPSLATYPGS
jgi:hypothetical protein